MKYNFAHDDSVIHTVEIHKAGGSLQATIEAPDMPPAALEEWKTALGNKGLHVIADYDNGTHILHIEHVASAEQLLGALAADDLRAVTGNYTVSLTEHEKKENKSFTDLIKENTLTLAGLFYLTGDAFLFASGKARGDVNEMMNAGLWAIPNSLLMVTGHQNPDVVNGFVARDFKEQLENHGIDIPLDAQKILDSNAAGHSLKDRALQTVYEHGPEVNNAFEIFGAAQGALSGINQDNTSKIAASTAVITGMSLGLLLNEKKKPVAHSNPLGTGSFESSSASASQQANNNDKSVIEPTQNQGFFASLAEKPPQFWAGTFPKLNNLLSLLAVWNEKSEWNSGKTWHGSTEATFDPLKTTAENKAKGEHLVRGKAYYKAERNKLEATFNASTAQLADPNLTSDARELLSRQNKDHKIEFEAASDLYTKKETSAKASTLNAIAACMFFIANQCYSHTKKDNSVDIEKVGGVSTMLAVMANIVVAHPKAEQPQLTEQLSMLLAENKHINLSVEEASAKLHEKVEALNKSPWLGQSANNAVAFTRKSEPSHSDNSLPDVRITTAHQSEGRMVAEPQLAIH